MSVGAARLVHLACTLVAAAVLALCFSAPVRAVTGLSIATSLALAIPIAVVVAILAVPRHVRIDAVELAIWGVLLVVAFVLLSNRQLGPLAAYMGSDAGVHVEIRDEFIHLVPTMYAGFVTMYGFSWWLERITHASAYAGFTAVFYAVVVALVIAFARSIARLGRGFIATMIGVLLVAALVLPILSLYQADGFFSQLWGVLPVLVFWLLDVSRVSRVRRIALTCVVVAVARYTYGLVLGDLVTVVIALIVIELHDGVRDRRWRAGAGLAIAACLVGLVPFYRQLQQVAFVYGYFIHLELDTMLVGTTIVLVAVAVASVSAPAIARYLRVPLLIGASNTLALAWLHLRFPGEHYYLLKYDFHALMLLAVATSGLAAYALHAERARGLAIVALVGLAIVGYGMRTIYPPFAERIAPRETHQHLSPLVDFAAERRITARLRSERAAFGGYLVPNGPVFNFMNAERDRYAGGYFKFEGLDQSPGHCVFWTHDQSSSNGLWREPSWMWVAKMRLEATASKTCDTYRPYLASRNRQLCSVCYGPADQQKKQQRN